MKLNLRYTSGKDKRHIRQAAKLRSTGEAERKGWSFIGNGAFKSSYKKGNIVVKFNRENNDEHMIGEMNLYKKTPKKYKKYLARVFGADGEKIIQKFVRYEKEYSYSQKEIRKIRELSKVMKIQDTGAGHNVVKTNDKKIVFYDFGGHWH